MDDERGAVVLILIRNFDKVDFLCLKICGTTAQLITYKPYSSNVVFRIEGQEKPAMTQLQVMKILSYSP